MQKCPWVRVRHWYGAFHGQAREDRDQGMKAGITNLIHHNSLSQPCMVSPSWCGTLLFIPCPDKEWTYPGRQGLRICLDEKGLEIRNGVCIDIIDVRTRGAHPRVEPFEPLFTVNNKGVGNRYRNRLGLVAYLSQREVGCGEPIIGYD